MKSLTFLFILSGPCVLCDHMSCNINETLGVNYTIAYLRFLSVSILDRSHGKEYDWGGTCSVIVYRCGVMVCLY